MLGVAVQNPPRVLNRDGKAGGEGGDPDPPEGPRWRRAGKGGREGGGPRSEPLSQKAGRSASPAQRNAGQAGQGKSLSQVPLLPRPFSGKSTREGAAAKGRAAKRREAAPKRASERLGVSATVAPLGLVDGQEVGALSLGPLRPRRCPARYAAGTHLLPDRTLSGAPCSVFWHRSPPCSGCALAGRPLPGRPGSGDATGWAGPGGDKPVSSSAPAAGPRTSESQRLLLRPREGGGSWSCAPFYLRGGGRGGQGK